MRPAVGVEKNFGRAYSAESAGTALFMPARRPFGGLSCATRIGQKAVACSAEAG